MPFDMNLLQTQTQLPLIKTSKYLYYLIIGFPTNKQIWTTKFCYFFGPIEHKRTEDVFLIRFCKFLLRPWCHSYRQAPLRHRERTILYSILVFYSLPPTCTQPKNITKWVIIHISYRSRQSNFSLWLRIIERYFALKI